MRISTYLLALPILFLSFSTMKAQSPEAAGIEVAANEAAKIKWMSFEEALEANKKEPRKWMIDVYTDWCGWCKRMDKTTMEHPVIIQVVNEHYYAVKLDGEYKKDIVVNGRTYKYIANGRRGYHELPAELMQGKMSYPTIVFLDEAMQIIQPLPGYQTAAGLDPILNYFGGDYYKSTAWDKFTAEYKSPVSP